MLKNKVVCLLAAPFLLLSSYSSFAEEYTLTGPVESVSYNDGTAWPCYIAVTRLNDNDSGRTNHFHASKSISICQFAERAKVLNYNVKIDAYTDSGANVVTAVEFADTKAEYWK